jgi:D-alanyl-D-alanine dipeptidase
MNEIVLMSDPRVAAIPVADCGEPLVDVRRGASLLVDTRQQLRAIHTGWSDEQIHTAASRYVSPADIAPHTAGAAVDLTLADAGGRELDLGTPMNANPEESEDACYTDAVTISEEARANRKVLGAALAAAGLVNYPTEWWHWSFGDRYWALITGEAAACYGPCR